MMLCKFSPSYEAKNQTLIDNRFINEFLPKAPDVCVKVYLMGLACCSSANENENTIETFAKKLNICEDDVVSCFKYWEGEGLVQVLSTSPVEVRYLPITSATVGIKKLPAGKLTLFNMQLQELFDKRMLLPNEYAEFHNLIERYHFEEDALLAIVKYCIEMKGFNLSPNYCITVAKDWEREGITTLAQVQQKIEDLGIADDKLGFILEAMGTKRKVQIEDKELLNKWLNSFGFELNVIVYVAKSLKAKKRKLDINILDEYLTKYFELKLTSILEIENYENEKENLYFVATSINKELGLYYEDLTKEIDTYVMTWLNMGFDRDTLCLIADNCFKSSIRTLEGFNNIVTKLFKLGIVNTKSYMEYLNDSFATDEKIREVLTAVGINRNINNVDRNFYLVWTNEWGFEHGVIMYAASLANGKSNAIQYLNKILSNWNSSGIKTLDKAKSVKIENEEKQDYIHNNYTKEQIASFITNLDDVEV